MSSSLCTIFGDSLTEDRKRTMSALGAYIEEQIRARGWSQQDLSDKSGVPNSTLSRMINEPHRQPRADNVVRIAEAFEDAPAKLLILAGYPVGKPLSPESSEQELITQIRSFPWLADLLPQMLGLDSRGQATVRAVIEVLSKQQSDPE